MKRIALCLDGTWNNRDPGSTLTNVAKLHACIAKTDTAGVEQRAIYVDGIASIEGEAVQFLKGAVGFGVASRIQHAYALLVQCYEPGDEIFLFGFSRGAFEARSLAGFVALVGIAQTGTTFSVDEAWTLYSASEAKRSPDRLAALRGTSHYPVRIKCVGVWDTVGNIGNPLFSGGLIAGRYKFHDLSLSDAIEVGLHALSVDELRGPFRPTLWTLPEGRAPAPHQHVEQVWFAGTHADVGGGFRETALSDIALKWMAERAGAKAGIAIDSDKLVHLTRADPLGPQHASATGRIFGWSALFPFVRLVKQAPGAISPWRRALFGSWRSSLLPRGVTTVNEEIHESVLERLGKPVIELVDGRSRMIAYLPRNLVAALPDEQLTKTEPAASTPRRVKVFTVHGTFDHEAGWDNWDPRDDPAKPSNERSFINRLSTLLSERGIALDELDHTQYNWSGGNSHDERRTAAIGLKKLIEEELRRSYDRHGKDYYDAVYVVGHSHGGTVARLAMNLWDKPHDYYDPQRTPEFDEFKHDDRCETCLRSRNGEVGPNTVRRPDGVITFGSPFVSFEQRREGLRTARIGAWVFRILATVPVLIALYFAKSFGAIATATTLWSLTPGFMKTAFMLLWPLAITWLIVAYLPRLLTRAERWLGKGNVVFALSALLHLLGYVAYIAAAVHYAAYLTGQYDRLLQGLPVGNKAAQYWAAWFAIAASSVFLVIAFPGAFLDWLWRKVEGLRDKLPRKYDPPEDRPVAYLSYHTFGDEAGIHLRIFGILTWAVQALGLAAASVLAVGTGLMIFAAVEAVLNFTTGGGVLETLGVSPVSDRVEIRDRFITLYDTLTYYPRTVWSWIAGASWSPALSSYDNDRAVAWYVPIALVISILLVFMLLMPLVLAALLVVYLVSIWLRGSGVVFGSESFAWTLANKIAVRQRPNENTSLRRIFISPEAWWRREMAHCYYYKADRVIRDLAQHIADWGGRKATAAWPIEATVAASARWLVVALFVFSVFATSVPIAASLAPMGPQIGHVLGLKLDAGPGSQPKPRPAGVPAPIAPDTGATDKGKEVEPQLIEQDATICRRALHRVKIVIERLPSDTLDTRAMAAIRAEWEQEVAQKFGAEWAIWPLGGENRSCQAPAGAEALTCEFGKRPCKWRAIECKDAAIAREATFELGGLSGQPGALERISGEVIEGLKQQWQIDAAAMHGAEWADVRHNFRTVRAFRPIEDACRGGGADGGRVLYHCRVSAAPCKTLPTEAETQGRESGAPQRGRSSQPGRQ